MATGLSLLMIAAGAIIIYALNVSIAGPVNIDVIGAILVIVGIVGLVFSLLFMASAAGDSHGHA